MKFCRIQMEGFAAGGKVTFILCAAWEMGQGLSQGLCVASAQLSISSVSVSRAHFGEVHPSQSHACRLVWKSVGLEFGRTTINQKNSQGKSLETEQLMNQRGIRREREAKGEWFHLLCSPHLLCQGPIRLHLSLSCSPFPSSSFTHQSIHSLSSLC